MKLDKSRPLRLKYIACKVLQREVYHCASRSGNVVDVHLMPQGLHNEPEKLHSEVQKALEVVHDVQGRPYDAVLLGYGLCSNGVVGLKCDIPMVIPRGHDCITILLGSKEKYKDLFDSHRGVFWFSPGWIEHNDQPSKERQERTYAEYVAKYGSDNAKFLMESEQNWLSEYEWAIYIDWESISDERFKKDTRESAQHFGWGYKEVAGSSSLVQRLVDGDWDEEDFLLVEPGQTIAADVDNPGIIKVQ